MMFQELLEVVEEVWVIMDRQQQAFLNAAYAAK